jgi:CRISPR-associated endoribonuclease Cas6
MRLNFIQLAFSLTLEGSVHTPCDLFDLSRQFPGSFRKVTCGRDVSCGTCLKAAGCRWFPLFGQQLSTDPEAVKRHQKPPLPFVFGIPLLVPEENAVRELELQLILVGSAVMHAADFIRGVERYCACVEPGTDRLLTLDSVSSRGMFGERSPMMMTKRGDLSGDLRILAAEDLAGKTLGDKEQLTLTFLTPLRQFRDGRLVRTLDVSAFLRGVIRRISSLVAAYGDAELEADFKWLAEQSRAVEIVQTELVVTECAGSHRGGLQGRVTLAGNLAPFLPYLLLGEYLHAGKGASWGFGRYIISD